MDEYASYVDHCTFSPLMLSSITLLVAPLIDESLSSSLKSRDIDRCLSAIEDIREILSDKLHRNARCQF